MHGEIDDAEEIYAATVDVEDVFTTGGVNGEFFISPVVERGDISLLVRSAEGRVHVICSRLEIGRGEEC